MIHKETRDYVHESLHRLTDEGTRPTVRAILAEVQKRQKHDGILPTAVTRSLNTISYHLQALHADGAIQKLGQSYWPITKERP